MAQTPPVKPLPLRRLRELAAQHASAALADAHSQCLRALDTFTATEGAVYIKTMEEFLARGEYIQARMCARALHDLYLQNTGPMWMYLGQCADALAQLTVPDEYFRTPLGCEKLYEMAMEAASDALDNVPEAARRTP